MNPRAMVLGYPHGERSSRQLITFSPKRQPRRICTAPVSTRKKEQTMSQTSGAVSHLMHRIWSSAMVSGVLAAILGVVILVWPGPSIVVASGVFGAYLVVSGVALAVVAFSLPTSTAGRVLNFVSGVASVILGILAFRHFGEGYATLLLAIWVGVGFIVRGVSALATTIADKQLPGRGWAIFFGIVSVIAGVVVLAFPFDSIVTLALVVGIWLIVLGVIEVVSGLSVRSEVKNVEHVTGLGARPHALAH
jgi:uncharacterized membrane protein HdeD (DUF308 family)